MGFFAVADGIGGYAGGEVASRLAVETLQEFLSMKSEVLDSGASVSTVLRDGLKCASRRIAQNSSGLLSRMCTTVASVYVRDGRAFVMHVGDSRVYRIRGGKITQLTQDHSLVNEMRQASGAEVTPSVEYELGHIVTQYVGAGHSPEPDVAEFPVRSGDQLLICSDGLSDILSSSQLCATVLDSDPTEACQDLVWDAYHLGGVDNITAVLVEID